MRDRLADLETRLDGLRKSPPSFGIASTAWRARTAPPNRSTTRRDRRGRGGRLLADAPGASADPAFLATNRRIEAFCPLPAMLPSSRLPRSEEEQVG